MDQNPFGIMNKATYNYFAHLRTILFPDSAVTTSKRLTHGQYMHGYSLISAEAQSIRQEAQAHRGTFRNGVGGLDSVVAQIGLDNFHLRLGAYDGDRYHGAIVNYFSYGLHGNPVASASFAKLMEVSLWSSGYSMGLNTEDKQKLQWLKKTFPDHYINLSNKYL